MGRKDFSESKSLLYVACTRAIKYLGFVDLHTQYDGETLALVENENSWINALRIHRPEVVDSNLNWDGEDFIEKSLIQKDSLGIEIKNGNCQLGIISELSVTRFSSIADCPFKFYLKNICKIEADRTINTLTYSEEEDPGNHFYSSMQRGTALHAVLSELYTGKKQIDDVSLNDRGAVAWAFELGKSFLGSHNVESEKLIKFSLFGQMMSGTPDLVFTSKQNSVIVWDFKTGKREDKKEVSYWLQLMCYAHAYSQKNQLSEESLVEIALVYLDEKTFVNKKISVKEITQLLFHEWCKTDSLNQVNSFHCPSCDFHKICIKGQVRS